MTLTLLRQFVDECCQDLSSTDLRDAHSILGLDHSKEISLDNVIKELYDRIRGVLKNVPSDNTLKAVQFKKLQEELIYQHVLNSQPAEPYLKIMRVIWDASPKNSQHFPKASQRTEWLELIRAAKNYLMLRPDAFDYYNNSLRDEFPEVHDRAMSAQRLSEVGGQVEIENSEIVVRNHDELAVKLEEMISKIGGITLAGTLLNFLSQQGCYSSTFERYFFSQGPPGISVDRKSSIPFGYLMQLSIKTALIEGRPQKNLKRKVAEIIDFATILVSANYGVERYGFWSYHFQTGDTIIKFLVDLAVKDGTFSANQLRPSFAILMGKKLFEHIDQQTFQAQLGFSKQLCFEVLEYIFNQSSVNRGPVIIYASDLTRSLRQPQAEILAVLNFFSHEVAPNAEYRLPVDVSAMTFFLKPFIKMSPTKFCMIDRSFAAPNVFEAIATRLREGFTNLDSDVGTQLEKLLGGAFQQHGITFHAGNYKVAGVAGECDFLLESNNAIILIEFKKKVLTRASRSGIDLNILIDLADSLLSAQWQAGRTEVILRQQGRISLTSNGNTTEIELGNRTIERIALTHTEFGSFQDRVVIQQFLKILLNHSIHANTSDDETRDKISKFERKRAQWCQQYDQLSNLNPSFTESPFFDCWFLSLSQLMELINISNDNESFVNALMSTKYVTFQTLDFYRELSMRPPFAPTA